jgi:signal peptidase II
MKRLFTSALIAFLVDQITKYLVVVVLRLDQVGTIDVWPPYLVFQMAWNRGVNFGLFGNNADTTRLVLIVMSLAISALVAFWALRERHNAKVTISAGLVVGGALGNVIDRIRLGAVADFLNTSCCGIENPFSFNLADVFIFVGIGGLILWGDKKKTT